MIKIPITSETVTTAKASIKHGELKGSYRKGEGNFVGAIGEALFHEHYPSAIRINNFNYDFEFKGLTVDVKATFVPNTPLDYYRTGATNPNQTCDYYFIVQVLKDLSYGFLIGYITKEKFYKEALFRKKGTEDMYKKGYFLKGDYYYIQNHQLKPPRHP